jgi:hypothetical protein
MIDLRDLAADVRRASTTGRFARLCGSPLGLPLLGLVGDVHLIRQAA